MNNIGKKAPAFYATTSQGEIYFPNAQSEKWTVLYFYEGDFTPISALDIQEFSKKAPKFAAYNTEIIGVSSDSAAVHIAWVLELRNMDKDGKAIETELVSDKNSEIARLYGTDGEKAVVIVGPDGIIRSFHKYSNSTGLNVTEIERELLALQTGGLTPTSWVPGDYMLEPPPTTVAEAQSAVTDRENAGQMCVDWYICYKLEA